MDTRHIAQQFGQPLFDHRNQLVHAATGGVEAMGALAQLSKGLERDDHDLVAACRPVQESWHGIGADTFLRRTQEQKRVMKIVEGVTTDAEKVLSDASAELIAGQKEADRLVDEYLTHATQALDAGVAVNGTGASAALMHAVGQVTDTILPKYTTASAQNLRRTTSALAEAAQRIQRLVAKLHHDGFADPQPKAKPHHDKPQSGGGHREVGGNGRSHASGTAAKVLDNARKNIGYRESGDNIDKFGAPGEPWCSDFATKMWQQAGVKIPHFPFSGDVYKWGEQHGQSYGANNLHQARPGDVLCFGTGPQNGQTSHHIGIVESVHGDSVTMIEGNSGPGSNAVTRQTHPLSSSVFYGGVHPS